MKIKMIHSTKKDGNTSLKYDFDNTAITNRKAFFEKHNIPVENTLVIQVKYRDSIVELDEIFLKNHPDLSKETLETDAVVTKCPNVFLYLPFGDCIPLIVFDPDNHVFAFAHMGWQSTEMNLHIKILEYLQNHYGTNLADVEVFLGPSIKKESYILKNPSQLKHSSWTRFLNHIGNDCYEIDLNGYICNDLRNFGTSKINNSLVDTMIDYNYFSHYRVVYKNSSEVEGRFICGAIMTQ